MESMLFQLLKFEQNKKIKNTLKTEALFSAKVCTNTDISQ